MAEGVLQVYAVPHMPYWHASIGKNASHRPATEVILCNLDGDNVISPEFVQKCVGHFAAGRKLVWFHDGTAKAGNCGRIAYLSESFCAVRGYDQDLLPMGYQDLDIIARLQKHLSAPVYRNSSERLAVQNAVPAKIANIDPAIKTVYPKWGNMNTANGATCLARLLDESAVRNLDCPLGLY